MSRFTYLLFLLASAGILLLFRHGMSGTSEVSLSIAPRPSAPNRQPPKSRETRPEPLPPPRVEHAEEPPRMVGPDGTPIRRAG